MRSGASLLRLFPRGNAGHLPRSAAWVVREGARSGNRSSGQICPNRWKPKKNLCVQEWTEKPAREGEVRPAGSAPTGCDLFWARRLRGHLGCCGVLRPDPGRAGLADSGLCGAGCGGAGPEARESCSGERDWDPNTCFPRSGARTIALQVLIHSSALLPN